MTIKNEICPQVKADVRLCDDGTLWVKTEKIADIGRVIVEDGKTSCKQFYQDAPEPCEDAVSRKAVQYLLAHFVDEDKYVDACDGLKHLPLVTPKQPEPCEDAVSRETLVNFIKNASVWVTYKKGDSEDEAEFAENIIKQTKQAIISMIELDLSPVTPKQRTGKWLWQTGKIKCNQCLRAIRRIDHDGLLNFCPNCGAKMEGDAE